VLVSLCTHACQHVCGGRGGDNGVGVIGVVCTWACFDLHV